MDLLSPPDPPSRVWGSERQSFKAEGWEFRILGFELFGFKS